MTAPQPTLVLALGNPLRGDDGVGAAVLGYLESGVLPPGVTLLDGGTPGLETALIIRDYRQVIIIDAADMGAAPGTWRQFSPSHGRLLEDTQALRGTLHRAGLAEALALAEALGILPPEIVIYGVQPEIIGWEPGLSDSVRAVVPQIGRKITEHWEAFTNGQDSGCGR